jgi:hypothetical protein
VLLSETLVNALVSDRRSQPTGSGAEISAVLAHEGNGFAFGLDVKNLI